MRQSLRVVARNPKKFKTLALLCLLAFVAGGGYLYLELHTSQPDSKPTFLETTTAAAPRGDVLAMTQSTTSPNSDQATDWSRKYASSNDAYRFVREAARKALDGDARAAFYVGKIASRCAGVERTLRDASIDQVMSSRELQLMQFSSISLADRAAILARERSNYDYCAEYARENPFDGLPANGNYKKRAFWQDLAYQGGEPLALADHALEVLQSSQTVIGSSTDQEKLALRQAQDDINRASRNLQPETLFALSAIFMAPEFQSMPNQFSILLLASCNLGYDCTAINPQLGPIFECTVSGSCPAGFTIDDFVKSYLGTDGSAYSSVYAQADSLATAIRQGDAATVRNFLTLKFNAER